MFSWLRELLRRGPQFERELAPSARGGRHIDLASRVCAWDLLNSNLTPEQARELHRTRAFDVIGGATGRRYRIRHGFIFNVDLLNEQGRRVASFCFRPRGDLPLGDIMLAQKNVLELFELEALKIANCLRPCAGSVGHEHKDSPWLQGERSGKRSWAEPNTTEGLDRVGNCSQGLTSANQAEGHGQGE